MGFQRNFLHRYGGATLALVMFAMLAAVMPGYSVNEIKIITSQDDGLELVSFQNGDATVRILLIPETVREQGKQTYYWYRLIHDRRVPGVQIISRNTYYQSVDCTNGKTYGPFVAQEEIDTLQVFGQLNTAGWWVGSKLPPPEILNTMNRVICSFPREAK